MSARTNRAVALRTCQAVNEALASGDLDLLDDFIAFNFVHHDLRTAATASREELKLALRQLRDAFPDLRITASDLIAEGDRVASRIDATATHLGNWGDLPPTGQPVVWSGLQMIRVTGGMVVEHWGPDLIDAVAATPSGVATA
jgi:predicted ester cyclase